MYLTDPSTEEGNPHDWWPMYVRKKRPEKTIKIATLADEKNME